MLRGSSRSRHFITCWTVCSANYRILWHLFISTSCCIWTASASVRRSRFGRLSRTLVLFCCYSSYYDFSTTTMMIITHRTVYRKHNAYMMHIPRGPRASGNNDPHKFNCPKSLSQIYLTSWCCYSQLVRRKTWTTSSCFHVKFGTGFRIFKSCLVKAWFPWLRWLTTYTCCSITVSITSLWMKIKLLVPLTELYSPADRGIGLLK